MRFRPTLTILCVAAAVVALAARILSIAEPLGIDQSLWASAVRGMSRHQLLYRDVWEQKTAGHLLHLSRRVQHLRLDGCRGSLARCARLGGDDAPAFCNRSTAVQRAEWSRGGGVLRCADHAGMAVPA